MIDTPDRTKPKYAVRSHALPQKRGPQAPALRPRPRVPELGVWKDQNVFVLTLAIVTGLICAAPAATAEAPQMKDAPVGQLIQCLSAEAVLESRCPWPPQDIQDELVRRRPITRLVQAYRHSPDPDQRRFLLDVLYRIDSPRIARFMRREATREPSETSYFANSYLARRGSRRSLGILARNFHAFPVSSLQMSATARLFGTLCYRPAVPALVSCLRAGSGNLQEAALASLRMLFPGAPAEFQSTEDAIRYFETARCEPR